ncbi:MAG TPA: HAMP domain-containing sensor histidine kinase [Gemmatimonadaceae bacterium]|nr:HAMP domain-containing sensor histidine kinase [Gemmatimonadaceae bacterium]
MIMPPGRDDTARRGAFASMVAHELRTPLTAAYGALEMIARAGSVSSTDDARNALLIDLAHRNTQRLLRIVEDCLDLEAASDDRLTLERALVQPSDVAALGVDGARSAREQTGVDVMLQLDARRGIVGDRLRLGRALGHLVQNAVTFAPRGSVVTVTTSDDDDRGTVRFAVEDRGAGIEPEQLRALFQRFDVREAPGRSRVGGLGLGLAFVRMVAEQHGGVVAVKSTPGCTKIAFEIPWDVRR